MLENMFNETVLNSKDPGNSLAGMAEYFEDCRGTEPLLYRGFVKKASEILGKDFLVDCFLSQCSSKDLENINTSFLDKKASEKISKEDIFKFIKEKEFSRLLKKSSYKVGLELKKKVL